MNLSLQSIEALTERWDSMVELIDLVADPESAELVPCAAACTAVLANWTGDGTYPVVAALAAQPLAQRELDEYLTGDHSAHERNPILRDLCRAGYFERANPHAVCSRRIATMVVDGVRYEVGSYS